MALVSTDFYTAPAPVSTDFSVERASTLVSTDFQVRTAPASTDFSVAAQADVTDTTYAVSEDCSTVTVTVPGFAADDVMVANAFLYGTETPIAATVTNTEGTFTAVFPVEKDGAYEVQATINGAVATIPILVSCRSNKCYAKMNNRKNSCCPDTRLAYALLAGATSSFATEQFLQANDLFERLNELCTDCGCGCSC